MKKVSVRANNGLQATRRKRRAPEAERSTGFVPYWANVAADPVNPEHTAGRKFTDTPNGVFSRMRDTSPWPDTRIARDLVGEIGRLKQQPDGDLIAYGGAAFVASLIAANLIDEYHLFVKPVAIGAGLRSFGKGVIRRLRLVRATAFECGIVALHYQPPRADPPGDHA